MALLSRPLLIAIVVISGVIVGSYCNASHIHLHCAMLVSMNKAIDWTHLFEKHRGKWVALSRDETTVLAAADTAKEAHRQGLMHTALPILYRVPETLDLFAGYAI